MANKFTEALGELGERARELLAELGLVGPKPELVPVPVRNNPRPRRPGDRRPR